MQAEIKEILSFFHFLRTAPFSHLETKGEGAICVKFRVWLTEQTLADNCRAVWFHPQNESNQSSKNYRFWNFQRNMGKFAGVSDYVFMGNKINLALEIKDGFKNKQSECQEFFESWCDKEGVPYELAHSFEEAVMLVLKHGIVELNNNFIENKNNDQERCRLKLTRKRS